MKVLEISNVNKVYKNGKVALNNLSLSIEAGEFIALLGPNGAGKSTLINILGDVVLKTSGTINLLNFNIDANKTLFKRHIGIVPQELNFDPFFTPLEVLIFQQGMYGIKKDLNQIKELLKNVGLEEQTNTYARSLSGGMKRRLLVAKAMIHNPEVIILDEPTAGVDVELRQQLWEFLKKENKKGKTIILTTHYLEEAEQLCDKIAIINKGSLITYEEKNKLISKIGTKSLEVTTTSNLQNLNLEEFTYNITENNKVNIPYKNDEDMGKILTMLGKNHVVIHNLKIKEPSLEEVFLNLTHK